MRLSGNAQLPPNAPTMPTRSMPDMDSAPFQIPISGPSAATPQTGNHSGPSTPFARTEPHPAPHAPPPFINATNQQLVHRPPSHPNASTNSHSLSAPDPRMSQSPARSATATPSSSVNHPPPQLVESRDSLQIQVQASRGHQHPPQQSHQQGMQLHPPPGSTPASLPMQQLSEPVIRQQHMLSQRGQQSAQLARPNFPVTTNPCLPNQFPQLRHANAATQPGSFPNPGNHVSSAQPMQSRPSSRAGPPAIAQPTQAAGHTPRDPREEYSEQSSAGLHSSQPPSDASSQTSQSSARSSAPMMGASRPLSGHQGNGSPSVPR